METEIKKIGTKDVQYIGNYLWIEDKRNRTETRYTTDEAIQLRDFLNQLELGDK